MFDETGQDHVNQGCTVITPPQKIRQRVYLCDRKFHTEVILDLFQDKESYGLVHVGGTDSSFYCVTGKNTKKLDSTRGFIKNQHKKGGQSQNRYQRLTQIQIDDYVKSVSEKIECLYQDTTFYKAIVLCGSGNKKDMVKERLPSWLSSITTMYTLPDDNIDPVVNSFTIPNTEQKKALVDFHNALRDDMAVYGKEETYNALECGYLDFVITTEESWRCLADDRGTTFIFCTNYEFISHFGGCGGVTRWKVDL